MYAQIAHRPVSPFRVTRRAVRGEFRSVPSSRYDRVELHQLSHLAFRVYMTLDGTNGATGIKAVYRLIIAERCGCTPTELDAAYRELERPLQGGSDRTHLLDAAWAYAAEHPEEWGRSPERDRGRASGSTRRRSARGLGSRR